MKLQLQRLLGVVPAVFLIGCSGDVPTGDPREASTVRDSVGIRLVENQGELDIEAPWKVPTNPVFRLGWSSGDLEFEDLRFGVIGPGNRVVVADAGANVLHVFSSQGRLIATLGGEGEGPGEFLRITSVLRLGQDSLLVADGGNARLTVFDGGDYAHDLRFMSVSEDAIYDPIGRNTEGAYVLSPTRFLVSAMEDGPTGWRDYPVLLTRNFVETDTVARLGMWKTPERGDWNPIRHFGFSVLAGGALVHAKSDEPKLIWLREDGTPTQIARWDAGDTFVTEDDWAEYERGARLRADPDGDPERLEQRLRDRRRDFGGRKPLFRSVHGDQVGNLWLGLYDFSRLSSSSFAVVSRMGEWLGLVGLPRDIRILDIAEDLVLGVESNDLGVQALVLYQLEKPDVAR